jgi:hypothetical protein
MIALLVVSVITVLLGAGVLSVAPPDTTLKPESPLADEPAAAPLPPPASAATSAVVVSNTLQKARVDRCRMASPQVVEQALSLTMQDDRNQR